MEEFKPADADNTPVPQRDAENTLDAPDAAQNGPAAEGDDATVIKEEERPAPENGDGGGVMQRPVKRRKLDDSTPSRSASSRAVSPPWKAW